MANTISEETGALAEHGWLAFTPEEFRHRVLQRVRMREFGKGEAVYRAGDPPGGLWAVVRGAVEVEVPSHTGASQLAHFASRGFWFGEGPLIYEHHRRVGVVAARPTLMATLPLNDCHAILEADPLAWRWIALLASMTTDLAIGVVADLLLNDPVKRTAALLLRLAGVRSKVFVSKTPAPVYLSQEKIGFLVNLSRNSVTPILHTFAQRGLIELKYGSILVTDVERLAAETTG